jgi:hypothetical protein
MHLGPEDVFVDFGCGAGRVRIEPDGLRQAIRDTFGSCMGNPFDVKCIADADRRLPLCSTRHALQEFTNARIALIKLSETPDSSQAPR